MTVATRSGITTERVVRARGRLRKHRATATPTKVKRLTAALIRPFCNRFENASTSVVIRVMIRPAISLS
jgi:hypothetical protein